MEHLLPGQGPLALLVPLGLAVWGALGFVALSRQPLSIDEGRLETARAPTFPRGLRPVEGTLS